jgi:hypothetical protein
MLELFYEEFYWDDRFNNFRHFELKALEALPSLCPVDPVASVAEAGENVGIFVQLPVEGGGIDRNLRVSFTQPPDPFRGCD